MANDPKRTQEATSRGYLRLDSTITIRVSGGEKQLIAFFARQAGLSVGRYLTELMRHSGRLAVERLQARVEEKKAVDTLLLATRRRRRRRKPRREDLMRTFRTPFLQRRHAEPFERAIEHAARKANVSTFSVAWVASHLLEAIAREVAGGHVVRIPGFAAIGPWRIEERGVCVPRFQASPAFCDFLLVEGERAGANHELQAHRRRRKKRLRNLPKAMDAFRARVEAQNRRLLDDFEAWSEYGHGAGIV